MTCDAEGCGHVELPPPVTTRTEEVAADVTNEGDPYILTRTGRFFFFDPLLEPESISVDGIAQSLSKICRFTGQTSKFYSVAAHSVVVAHLVRQKHGDEAGLQALLHDAPEAYLGDVSSPLKAILGETYRRLERLAMGAILNVFGLEAPSPEIKSAIREADMIALAMEKAEFMPFDSNPWPCLEGIEIPKEFVLPHSEPFRDAHEFARFFYLLRK